MQNVVSHFVSSSFGDPSAIRRAASISRRIAVRAAAAPRHLAVTDGATRLSYWELERQSNQLAAYLRELGAGPEQCVGLLLDRSAQFVVAALAVLKAGAAYLPLDSSTPPDRAAFILADAGAPLLLTHRHKASGIAPGPWRIVDIGGADSAAIASRPADAEFADPALDSLAYVIYTSGSTGEPKGVEVTHANLLNLVNWHQEAFEVASADRASQVAGLGFDAAGWEIWPYLTAGASLHIADDLTRRSPHALRDWLVSEEVTIGFIPTILAEQLIHSSWPAGTKLRTMLTGADMLHRRPPSGLPFELVNNYGPTECTVVATSGPVAPDAGSDLPPSIGKPISHAAAFILDGSLRPVPAGEAGELCIAGALVARGYRNRPELTSSRFVTVSVGPGGPVRIYRTGDRARWLADGEIGFLGRLDDQVKIRGYRVELGEIIACLDRCPGVEASAVVLRDALPGEQAAAGATLVAYVVPAAETHLTGSDLRDFLAARLPDYMVPQQYVSMTALPMTANGKLDKSALPAPAGDNLLPNRAAPSRGNGKAADCSCGTSAPCHCVDGGFEKRIGDMVATLLGLPDIEREDDFFMVGGHSMLGAQLVARIRDTFGVKLTLRQLFDAPTVAALSAEVARLSQSGARAGVIGAKNHAT